MPLPELISIEPVATPREPLSIAVPGSKSITNRALILAALADGPVELRGALWSEDTQAMVDSLQRLGFKVEVAPDAAEECNRTIRVNGLGGLIPNTGTPEKPLELFVGNAGTAARFLAAMVCLGRGCFRLSGVPRMHERPQAELLHALRHLGYRVDSPNDKLPAVIHGRGPLAGACEVSIRESSQFASALILSARHGGWTVKITGAHEDEAPYVRMTERLVECFPFSGGVFQIEPDASSGSYIWGAGHLLRSPTGSLAALVPAWPDSGWQIDAKFPRFLPLPESISRERDLADSIMTAIVLAPLSGKVMEFTELGRLRVQECERVFALKTELQKCGAKVLEQRDTLTIEPSTLRGAEIETYNDHRMAMCFGMLALVVPGMTLRNPSCVKKTFPNFFQKLAAPQPTGFGAVIRDAVTGRILQGVDLHAE